MESHNHHHHAAHAVAHKNNQVVVELEAYAAEWEFAPGRKLQGWTYNGQVPGPTIEANVGDTIVVRLKNHLPEPTTIHWHGLAVPAEMDGTSVVQRLVQPGESFEYRFDARDAGTFWYHSHHNETVQMERGLYGALIVRGADEPRLDRERVFVLDDVKINRKGDFASFGGWIEEHIGREGDVRLMNGVQEPLIEMAAGQLERWRFVNASSARYILLSLGGVEFSIIGGAGGLVEAPVTATQHLLPPGDRVDVLVGSFVEGAEVSIESLPYDRHTGKKKVERFATVRVTAEQPSRALVPSRLRHIEPLASSDTEPTRVVTMSERLSLKRGTDFMINGEMHHSDAPVTVGELQIWDVVNASHMDHPFHLHGFSFQVLSVNGVEPAYRSWEDVVNVPPHGRVRIAWMPDDRPGFWMYHCHILEHHAGGMMANFAVVRAGESAMPMEHSCHV